MEWDAHAARAVAEAARADVACPVTKIGLAAEEGANLGDATAGRRCMIPSTPRRRPRCCTDSYGGDVDVARPSGP